MSKLFKTVLTVIIFLLVTACALLASYWGYAIKHFPWWVAASLALGVFGLYFFVLFLKKYLIRRREKKFVQRIVDHGEVLDEGVRPEGQAIIDLESSWKKNLGLLKKSHLRKRGNPLYVLPWYLAMGETGVGKSTMLANSGVSSSFTELEDKQGKLAPTRNCDWVFFDDAIVLDAAGRYSIPLSSNQEQNEWKRFLLLLSKSRRKEPLNGIILFVSAEDLVAGNSHTLRKKGQVLRNRIHSLMRTVGYKIPVSIMVTRMDVIPGFTEFAELLNHDERVQAMGQLNSQATPYWQELLNTAIDNIGNSLQKIRFSKVSTNEGRQASFFSFPLQMNLIKTGLESFLDVLFTENSFQETPVVQGIYFGSGTCQNAPLADFLQHPIPQRTSRLSSKGAIFAKDFFTVVLPSCRNRLEPVKEMLLWRKVTGNLAVLAWLCLTFFVAGLIGLSFLHNQKVIHMVQGESLEKGLSTAEPGSNAVLVSLEKMRLNILDIEKANKSWPATVSLFKESMLAESAYKKAYCTYFKNSLLKPMEEDFEKVVDTITDDISEDIYAEYNAYLVEQIVYLQNAMAGKKPGEFRAFNKVASAVLSIRNKELLSQVGKYFSDLNGSYLAWNSSEYANKERLLRLQKTLNTLLAKKHGDTSWLYSNAIADTKDVTLGDFWKKSQTNSLVGAISIPGAFTDHGREKIEMFLKYTNQAGAKSDFVTSLKEGYNKSYAEHFVYWWQQFGTKFGDGELALESDTEWREEAILMTSVDNPYFSLLKTMAQELKSFAGDTGETLPNWGEAVVAIDSIRQLALSNKKNSGQDSSLVTKISSEGSRVATEALQQVDPAEAAAMNNKLKMAEAWGAYENGLASLNDLTPYKEKAAQEFSAWFKAANGGKEPSVFSDVYASWVTLKNLNKSDYSSPLAWDIVYGPFRFLQDFAARDTAQILQGRWHEDVLSSVAGAGKDKAQSILFENKNGVVWKYIEDYADPFVMKSVNGYKARKFYDRTLLFKPGFYSFLNQGAQVVLHEKPQYDVTLLTVPTSVNRGATVEPYYVIFTMNCAKKAFVLENDNFPRELVIEYTPDTCGDVSLEIGFPSNKMTMKWQGEYAFLQFLQRFKTGSSDFTPTDFPDASAYLKEHHIEAISVSYKITGAEDALKLLNTSPDNVPDTVILPEDQRSMKSESTVISKNMQPHPINGSQQTNNNISAVADEPKQAPKETIREAQQVEKPQTTSKTKSKENDKNHKNFNESDWILTQDPSHYTIQIMSLQKKEGVENAFSMLPKKKDNSVYTNSVNGVEWYVLFTGVFKSRHKADKHIKKLPKSIQKAGPVIRTFGGIQNDIRDSEK